MNGIERISYKKKLTALTEKSEEIFKLFPFAKLEWFSLFLRFVRGP